MTRVFRVVRGLRYEGANMLAAAGCISGIQMTGIGGLANALGRHLALASIEGPGGSDRPALHLSIAVIHHDAAPQGETVYEYGAVRYRPHHLRKLAVEGGGNLRAAPYQPEALIDGEVSLIISYDRDSFPADINTDFRRHAAIFFREARFCGGRVVSCDPASEAIGSLAMAIRVAGRGFAVCSRDALVRSSKAPGEDSLATILRLTRPSKTKQDKAPTIAPESESESPDANRGEDMEAESPLLPTEEQEEKPDLSWLFLSRVGYRVVSPFRERAGTREGLPHAFAEPLLGLCQYISTRSISGGSEIHFWRTQQIEGRPELFMATHFAERIIN